MGRAAITTDANDFELQVTGLTELVRGKDATIVTSLDDIQALNPEETRLVHDTSAGYRRGRLYLEQRGRIDRFGQRHVDE